MNKELPLHSLWHTLGAEFTDEHGWDLPARFHHDFRDEYGAAMKGCGLLDLSARGKFKITGEDRVLFLHNILTQDIKSLKSWEGCSAALLTSTAKVLLCMNLLYFDDFLYIDFESGIEEKARELFDRHLITEDVSFADITERDSLLLVTGPRSVELMRHIFGKRAEELASYGDHRHVELDEIWMTAVCLSRTDLPQFALLVRNNHAEYTARMILERCRNFGIVPLGTEAYKAICMERGLLRHTVDITEEISLPETGLEETLVSTDKGCYPGQEVVARTETYSGLKQKLAGLILEGNKRPAAGDAVLDGDLVVGSVTSACMSPALGKVIAVALLKKDYFEAKRPVRVKTPDGPADAVTTPLPFIPLSRG